VHASGQGSWLGIARRADDGILEKDHNAALALRAVATAGPIGGSWLIARAPQWFDSVVHRVDERHGGFEAELNLPGPVARIPGSAGDRTRHTKRGARMKVRVISVYVAVSVVVIALLIAGCGGGSNGGSSASSTVSTSSKAAPSPTGGGGAGGGSGGGGYGY